MAAFFIFSHDCQSLRSAESGSELPRPVKSARLFRHEEKAPCSSAVREAGGGGGGGATVGSTGAGGVGVNGGEGEEVEGIGGGADGGGVGDDDDDAHIDDSQDDMLGWTSRRLRPKREEPKVELKLTRLAPFPPSLPHHHRQTRSFQAMNADSPCPLLRSPSR